MSINRTVGGDRLGTGKKMKVHMHNYERSTHDLSYLWRSTMGPGTLVPFMVEVGLPGDTFDIDLNADVMTHPTVGPLFGSFKLQLDVFSTPIRLYNAELHNNTLGIGRDMKSVKLPQIAVAAQWEAGKGDNSQINPSSLLSYLNIRGVGQSPTGETGVAKRWFNAVPYLAYFEIFKNYYANKQEEKGFAIVANIGLKGATPVSASTSGGVVLPKAPAAGVPRGLARSGSASFTITAGQTLFAEEIVLETNMGNITVADMFENFGNTSGTAWTASIVKINTANLIVSRWRMLDGTDNFATKPILNPFQLSKIDDMRRDILRADTSAAPFVINNNTYAPYNYSLLESSGFYTKTQPNCGLLVKTYQSDLFNNWMNKEWIDGVNGVAALSKVSTADGGFTIDALNLATKVYEMMNRIAISGGTYDDWMDVTYSNERYRQASTPMYMGGLSKEVVFQEVIANSDSEGTPLGTLGGRGKLNGKHKGGKVRIKVDEPSYIMGIVSLTPRIDYSQGNKWDTNLRTMDDFHKPALDEIGFQDLITDQMAWFDTRVAAGEGNVKPTFRSAGKQPAWLNYMTNVNQTRGNFAIQENEMFMTLNRRYEQDANGYIRDITTYIDPSKYNFIFAETSLDTQNFWVQIGVDIEARRKMSAKLMPNL